MRCSICFDTLVDNEELSCGHKFHKKCIENWFWQGKDSNTIGGIYDSCPLCRTVQTDNNFLKRKNNLINHIENKYNTNSIEFNDLHQKILELTERLSHSNLILIDLEKQLELSIQKWQKWKSKSKNIYKTFALFRFGEPNDRGTTLTKIKDLRSVDINSCGILF